MKILGVTKCPVGVAHTYMAAEKLEIVGKKLGHEMKIETQGSQGVENSLTDEDIKKLRLYNNCSRCCNRRKR